MSPQKTKWEDNRTEESRQIEKTLQDEGFHKVDAYRYNSASLRVRITDPQFEGRSHEERDALVEPALAKLDKRTQSDIVFLVLITESELQGEGDALDVFWLNAEFDNPSPSRL